MYMYVYVHICIYLYIVWFRLHYRVCVSIAPPFWHFGNSSLANSQVTLGSACCPFAPVVLQGRARIRSQQVQASVAVASQSRLKMAAAVTCT